MIGELIFFLVLASLILDLFDLVAYLFSNEEVDYYPDFDDIEPY